MVVVLMRCAMGSRGFFRGVGPDIGSALLLQIRSDNMLYGSGWVSLSLFCSLLCHLAQVGVAEAQVTMSYLSIYLPYL